MKLNNIKLSIEEIKQVCDRWNVIEFALFGSVLIKDFHSDSDIDVMVSGTPPCNNGVCADRIPRFNFIHRRNQLFIT